MYYNNLLVLKLSGGWVPTRVGQYYAVVGAGAGGQRSGSVAGAGQTRLQLMCCALATEPRCPIISEGDGLRYGQEESKGVG